MSTWQPERNRLLETDQGRHKPFRRPPTSGRVTVPGTIDPRTGNRIWRKRQAILDRLALDTRPTQGAKAWFGLLAGRSDEAGKPVWGNQTKMAAQLGRSARTIRRYLVELEDLGYIKVYRSTPLRGPGGRWSRRKSNSYYLRLPGRATQALPAPRRKQRAPYCGISAGGHRFSHLEDTDGRSSPQQGALTSAAPPVTDNHPDPLPELRPTTENQAATAARFAAIRTSLRQARSRQFGSN